MKGVYICVCVRVSVRLCNVICHACVEILTEKNLKINV